MPIQDLERLTQAAIGRTAASDVARLSRAFGEERAGRRADYMAHPASRGAYLAFFLPQYAAKIALLLAQARAEGLLPAWERPRVLDVGAGPLTGIFGAWLDARSADAPSGRHAGGAMPSTGAHADEPARASSGRHASALADESARAGAWGPSVALDLAGGAMTAGLELLRALAPEVAAAVLLVEQPVQQRPLPRGPFDLVIVAHVLNELGDPRRAVEQRARLLRDLVGLLAPGGRVLVVEPGTRVHGRALMAVRDALVDAGVRVLSPCRGARCCPLLRAPGDWCHGTLAWTPPHALVELGRQAGLEKTVLKHSHLLLAADGVEPQDGLRLVGGLMRDRAGVERRYACGRDLVVLEGTPRLADALAQPLRGALAPDQRERPHNKPARAPRRRR